ncbi:glutathione S-transferase omega-1 [Stegastes partitus]|nr:PREDICTED: glutathione S-transferase omega-1 [Stegastes partitus]
MVTQKSFAKGSAEPGPVPKDKIRIYSMRFCPFAQRARLVLEAKGINHETVNIHLKEKPEWFLAKNPLGLVPVLESAAGEIICESPITCEYLDEAYPEKKLLPSSPYRKAQQKMMLEHFSKVVPYFYKIPMGRRKGEDVSGLETEMKEKFRQLNEELVKKKAQFFGGDSVTMIDYLMWPWFERIEVFGLKHCMEDAPQMKQWMERMWEDPAVKATMQTAEAHKVFIDSYVEGTPNYDYGL